jgi:hypothetical protein
MCGILGFSRITDVTRRMAPFLAMEMESRGKDSWGATDGEQVIKHLGPITKSWWEDVLTWSAWSRAIFHTRAASVGAVTIHNQHPFAFEKDGTTIVGIHNGHVANYDVLNKKYERNYECDSAHVYAAIAGFSPTDEIRGWGNLAWYEKTTGAPEPILHLAKFNADNLFVASLTTGEIVFCSTKEIIERAALMAGSSIRTFFIVDSETNYSIHPSVEDPMVDGFYKNGKLAFGMRHYQQDFTTWEKCGTQPLGIVARCSFHSPPIDQLNAEDRMNNICHISNCKNKVTTSRRKALVCDPCLLKLVHELNPEVVA